jgi:hypothetical protein
MTLVVLLALAAPARAQCLIDRDCAGGELCRAGQCVPIIPQGSRTEMRRIPGLYITGAVLLAASWAVTVGATAALSDNDVRAEATGYAAIPVFGPWVLLGSNISISPPDQAALVVSGIVQNAGLAMLIVGVSVKRVRHVPVYSFGHGPGAATLAVLPSATPNLLGLVGAGTF